MGILDRLIHAVVDRRESVIISKQTLEHMTENSFSLSKNEVDITQTAKGFTGNLYPGYDSQVRETARKYEGRASWGSSIVQMIADVRSSFTTGMGVQPVLASNKEEGAGEAELAFLKDFLLLNGLSGHKTADWAKEAEIEGKFLCKLTPDVENDNVVARYIPWLDTGYKIITRSDDYEEYEKVQYTAAGEQKTIGKRDFVYAKFGGRTNMVNETPTKIGSVLTEIEAVARAKRDHREINHLFSFPTPVVICEDGTDASEVETRMKGANWKIGKLLVLGAADYKLVGPDIQGIESIDREIVSNIKIISGAVGLPVHFFGYTDLMSNRATADSLMELVFSATSKERQVWARFYTALFRKVLTIANEVMGKNFDPSMIQAEIPEDSQTKRRQIIDFWVELIDRKAISVETLLEQIPGVDAKQEMARLKDEQTAELQLISSQLPTPRDKPQGDKTKMENRLARP